MISEFILGVLFDFKLAEVNSIFNCRMSRSPVQWQKTKERTRMEYLKSENLTPDSGLLMVTMLGY